MSDEPCPRSADLAPYVLGALTEQEHADLREHLLGCRACREEAASLEHVAGALPAAVPQLAAPASLRGRVMATVRSEAALRTAGQRPPVSSRRTARLPWRWTLGSLATTAAAVLITVLLLGGSGAAPARTIRAQATAGARATLRVSSGHATLQIAGMRRTAPGRVYQVWVKRAGGPEPTDALFTVNDAGSATVAVPGAMGGVRAVMVTAEPQGGSAVPTTRPVIVAELG
jgi:hypothetical protein